MAGRKTDSRQWIEGFDGLRACAVFLVVAYHSANVVGASSAGSLSPIVAALKAGVTVFFVISGFLLYLPYARAIAGESRAPDWRDYARRRAARILPGYWVALTLMAAASLITGVFGPQWWRFYGLVQIYGNRTLQGGLGVAWTLAVEASFYVALPFLAWGIRRAVAGTSRAGAARTQLAIIAGLALASLELRGWLAGSMVRPVPAPRLAAASWLPSLWDWFALGLILAVLRAEWERGAGLARRVEALARRPARCWGLAAVAYLIAVAVEHGEQFLSAYGLATHLALGVAAALFVLPAVAPASGEREPSRPLALLRSRWLTWLGTISYGIFLWHVPLRDVVYRWLGQPRGAVWFGGMLVLTLALGVAFGAASWYLVERPAQAWIRGRRIRQGTAVPSRARVEPLVLGE